MSRPATVQASSIVSRPVNWLFDHRIPRGKLTMISGDPGLGKSFFTAALSKHTTLGTPLPESAHPDTPEPVLICNAEDDPADTFNPRLEALGADLTLVHYLTGIITDGGVFRALTLPDDAPMLDIACADIRPALIIIDPLAAFINMAVNTWQDAQVRGVLTPLAMLAAKWECAVVCIRHLTKGDRDQETYRGQGSIGFTGAARSELFLQRPDAGQPTRIMRTIKSNLAETDEMPSPIAFTLTRADGFQWLDLGHIEDSAAAQAFLGEILGTGSMAEPDAKARCIAAGLSEKAYEDAKQGLKVTSTHVGGRWMLSM